MFLAFYPFLEKATKQVCYLVLNNKVLLPQNTEKEYLVKTEVFVLMGLASMMVGADYYLYRVLYSLFFDNAKLIDVLVVSCNKPIQAFLLFGVSFLICGKVKSWEVKSNEI